MRMPARLLLGLTLCGLGMALRLDALAHDVPGETITIAYAGFSHETCTFCPSPPTGVEAFEYLGPPLQGPALAELERAGFPYFNGFLHALRAFRGVEVRGSYVVAPAFGGSSGSWITAEAFDKYSNGIAEALADIEGLDGVYLVLHGGMAVEGIARPEAELIRRIRERVGGIPIAATFDHHGNEDAALLAHLDIGLAVKRFPHYDADLMGARAARLLVRTIRGDYRPTMAMRKPGIVYATVYGGTHRDPIEDIMERARRWENRHLDSFVSVFQGWSFADVPDIGMAVMVMTNDDPTLAAEIADDMSAYIWSRRHEIEYPIPGVADGVAEGLAAFEAGRDPVVLANMSDRMGDSTLIARRLLSYGGAIVAIGTLADAAVLDRLNAEYGLGERVELSLGGRSSPLAGPPLPVKGTVRYLGAVQPLPGFPGERFATVETDDGDWIVITDFYFQVTDPAQLARVGVPVETVDIFVIKSRNHFRRGFMETGFARHAVVIDAPGHGPADIGLLDYRNMPPGTWSRYLSDRAIPEAVDTREPLK